jgi:hypothetical protein
MPNIRISKKDKEEYNKLMRNAKAKMKRLQKQGIDLTGEIELPTLSAFENRKQFNEWKDFTNKFNKGLKNEYKVFTTEKGVKLLGKEIKEFQEKQEIAIKRAEEHYKKVTPENEILFKKPTRMDIPDKIEWKNIPSRKYFMDKMENFRKRVSPTFFNDRDELFKNNFIKSIEGSFDSFWLSNEVVERLRKLPPDYFTELMKNEKFQDVFTFEIYDSEGQQVGANLNHLEAMNEILKRFEYGYLEDDFLLKNFPDKV